jgi:ubiquinone/menaquinone biosynthesis C-methylase UbiE
LSYFDSNEYVEYIRKHCDFREDKRLQEGERCTRPDLEIVHRYTDQLGLGPEHRLLEVGCGTGRVIISLKKRSGVAVHGVDISPKIISLAQEIYPEIANVVSAAPAEDLPFQPATFDAVLCWGVFDLTDQGRALAAMMEVLKVGGKLLVTGKHADFHDDDTEALAAEKSLRYRGIPNHFTNFDILTRAVETMGGAFTLHHFFERRGDFMQGKYLERRPARFYEYAVMVEKKIPAQPKAMNGMASRISETWKRVYGTET